MSRGDASGHSPPRVARLIRPVLLVACVLSGCAPQAVGEGDAAAPGSSCDRNTCTAGCCQPDGTCLRATTDAACGSDGQACQACASEETCRAGVCTRFFDDQATCLATCRGCCIEGRCAATPTDVYCGPPGGTCRLCAFHEQCVDGACALDPGRCGPHNCGGCCEDGLRCVVAPDATRCGAGGLFCEDCVESGYATCEAGRCQKRE